MSGKNRGAGDCVLVWGTVGKPQGRTTDTEEEEQEEGGRRRRLSFSPAPSRLRGRRDVKPVGTKGFPLAAPVAEGPFGLRQRDVARRSSKFTDRFAESARVCVSFG